MDFWNGAETSWRYLAFDQAQGQENLHSTATRQTEQR